jgi:hypothetical protein
MATAKIKQWYVQMEWEDGRVEQLYKGDLPDCVTSEIATYTQELEDFENNGWDNAYDTGWEDNRYQEKQNG